MHLSLEYCRDTKWKKRTKYTLGADNLGLVEKWDNYSPMGIRRMNKKLKGFP